MREPVWSDVWHLAMSIVGRASIEMQLLTWLGVLLAAVLFVEGVRSTFFRRMAQEAAARPPQRAAVPGEAARLLKAAQARHARKRVSAPRVRVKPLLPGIRRRPFYFERADVYDVLPEVPAIEREEAGMQTALPHLRIAS